MQVLSFDLLLALDFDSIEHPQLRNMEEHLQPIVLTVLEGIHAEINLCQELQILDELELIHFLDVVQTQVEEFQTFDRFEAMQSLNLVLGQIECPEHGQCLEIRDLCQVVSAQKQLFKPQVIQVFDFGYLVSVQ